MSVTDYLSIQLYTLRSMEDLDRILDTVAQAGYRYVETVGSHLDDVASVRSKLDSRGLKASSSHVSMAALREKPDAIVDACRTLDITDLYMPAVPPEQRDMEADGWRSLGRELGRLAERFKRDGIRLGYHNHHWELKSKDGNKTALELIFEEAEGSPLAWQVDVAWLVRGNADPREWMKRHRSRITAAHVKDIAPAGQNEDQDGWTDVGSGVLEWRNLWRSCREAGAKWMVVEHDKPANPAHTARVSFDFLRSIEE
ncbi:sugar phosphate isomerase/epimerase family protein [Microvirga lenta]|uniref:sugar phosphate isomerase/epimerase family protein n=1 Tax=Microvirga lenta TaxID=2881337 RepID=UPI001D0007C0|nr:sugar phosphate isomerase/epimerase [Microvirga lenta]MCB5177647.1 sugar phosphate isomerase/epimerase [Microvirga lenta]